MYQSTLRTSIQIFEALLVEKMKSKLIKNMSKFQISKAGHTSSEHIFVLKSVIALYQLLQIPVIIQFFDFSKLFDSESLCNGMNTIYNSGISGKLYQLCYKQNIKTKISIKTGVGFSDTKESGGKYRTRDCWGCNCECCQIRLD